jgi:4-hydroxybenzoyl-CoA reductase subunit beta
MSHLPNFELRRPTSIAEATRLLAEHPAARLIAGGTDLLPNLRRGIEAPPVLVDLSVLPDFAEIVLNRSGATLGAGVTLARLAANADIAQTHSALVEAAAAIAGPGHRSVATIGGNLCLDTRCVYYNQSEWWRAANGYCLKRGGDTCHVAPQGHRCHAAFSGDLAPALLVFDAEVELASANDSRRLPLAELYRDDGADHLALAPGELLCSVHVGTTPQRSGYRKARVRGAMDFPLAGVACALDLADGAIASLKVALTGTNSNPFVLAGTEAFVGAPVDDDLLGRLAKLVQKQVSPMRSTATASNYRRQVAAALVQRLVRELSGTAAPATA